MGVVEGVNSNWVHSALRPLIGPGDYDVEEIGGMMIGRGNLSIRRKPAPVPRCQPQATHALPGHEPGRSEWKPATDRLSYGTAKCYS
jgi:hypothetical protein